MKKGELVVQTGKQILPAIGKFIADNGGKVAELFKSGFKANTKVIGNPEAVIISMTVTGVATIVTANVIKDANEKVAQANERATQACEDANERVAQAYEDANEKIAQISKDADKRVAEAEKRTAELYNNLYNSVNS